MLHVSDWFIPIGEEIKLSKIIITSLMKRYLFLQYDNEKQLTTISQFSVKLELWFCWLQIILNTE